MNIKYSIVIPVYNNKKNVMNTLTCISLLKTENRFNFETILVDDGSSDGLKDVIHIFDGILDLQFVRLERTAQSCRARARNTGWSRAKGKYVVFLDSDILVKPDYLLQIDRYFVKSENQIVVGNRIHSDPVTIDDIERGDLFERNPFNPADFSNIDFRYLVFSSESFNAKMIPDAWLFGYSCNLAVSKKWLLATEGFDERYIDWGLEDIDLAYRFSLLGVTLSINPFLEVLHQATGHRDDISIGLEKRKGYLENVDYFLKRFPRALMHHKDPVHTLLEGKNYRELENTYPTVIFDGSQDINNIKDECMKLTNNLGQKIVLQDFTDNSNLDVWVQNLSGRSERIFYFPMLKKVDANKMMDFVTAQRNENLARQQKESLLAI